MVNDMNSNTRAVFSQAELKAADFARTGGEVLGTMIDATGNQLDTGGRAKNDCAALGVAVAGC
jgi:hypothetical protein